LDFAWATRVDNVAYDHWLFRLGSAGGRCDIGWLVGSLGDAGGRCGIRWLVGSLRQRLWTMRHPMVGSLGRRRWTMRHPMVGWFAWAAPVDDAASDGWLVRLDSAGGRCGIRWLVGSLGQRWRTMRHPMVGWFAWTALVGRCGVRRSTIPEPRKISPRRGGRKGHPEIPRFSGSLFDWKMLARTNC